MTNLLRVIGLSAVSALLLLLVVAMAAVLATAASVIVVRRHRGDVLMPGPMELSGEESRWVRDGQKGSPGDKRRKKRSQRRRDPERRGHGVPYILCTSTGEGELRLLPTCITHPFGANTNIGLAGPPWPPFASAAAVIIPSGSGCLLGASLISQASAPTFSTESVTQRE